MQAQIQVGPLLGEDDWTELVELVGADESALLQQLLRDYREAGAKAYLLERAYIDRDFSAAYSAFYSTLFHPYLKYCQRLHFFGCDLSYLGKVDSPEGLSREVASHDDDYLGYVVLRPVSHAPVAAAVISAAAIASDPSTIIDVTADYPVHLVGADLTVTGFPLTQQDTRVGACAQAAIWMAGRHFHRAHGGPWFSMPDINDAALKPTDNFVTRSLPAGSEFLRPDNIIRALRAMDRHPVFDLGKAAVEQGVGIKPLHEVIGRYLDSGIPVLIGLKGRDGATVGHAVVAIGRVMRERGDDDLPDDPTSAELISHLIVADDQRGPVCRLPVYKDDALDAGAPGAYPWTLEEDAVYSVTPLPGKVFMTGEVAETLSRDFLASCVERIEEYRELARMGGNAGGKPLPHRKHALRRAVLRRKRAAVAAKQQDLRGLARVISRLPVPRTGSIARAEGACHRLAKLGRGKGVARLEQRLKRLGGIEQAPGSCRDRAGRSGRRGAARRIGERHMHG